MEEDGSDDRFCPKCKGFMVKGKVTDNFGFQPVHYRDKRFKGVRFFTGDSRPEGLFKESGYLVNAYMCEVCGFLEFYGDLETDAGDIKDLGKIAEDEIESIADTIKKAFKDL